MQKRPREQIVKDVSMKAYEERKKGFEAKYARDQEMAFRVRSRRNKLLGLWAAENLGIEGEDARAYAMGVVEAGFKQTDDAQVVEKVRGDLAAAGVEVSEHRIHRELERLEATAQAQLEEELAKAGEEEVDDNTGSQND